MYQPPQQKKSSWTPSTAQNKSKSSSKLGRFSIQPKPQQISPPPQEIREYSRESADRLAANVIRGIQAKEQEQAESSTVQRQYESPWAPTFGAPPPLIQSPASKLKGAFAPVSENPIQRQCAECAKEEQEKKGDERKEVDEISASSNIQTKLTTGESGEIKEQKLRGESTHKSDEATDPVMRRVTPPVHSLIQRQENPNADKGDPVWRIKGILDGDPLWSLEQEPEPYKILDPLWILHMLKVLEALKSGGYLDRLSRNIWAANGVYIERIEVAIKAVQNKGQVSANQFKIDCKELLNTIPNQQQIEVLRYLDSHKIQGTKVVKTGWIDDIWTYVAYIEQKMIRVARHVNSTARNKRIGTIPWITNNPGNLTVAPQGKQTPNPGAREPFNQGAFSTIFRAAQTANMRYAIFPSAAQGSRAILPLLQVINKANNKQLTLKQALGIYYIGRIPKKDELIKDIANNENDIYFDFAKAEQRANSIINLLKKQKINYVKAVKECTANALMNEDDSLSRNNAQAKAEYLLEQRVINLEEGQKNFEPVLLGIKIKEGLLNPPGIEYHCDKGFMPNNNQDYTTEQFQAIEKFKADKKEKLRSILGCD